jgi:hypothetical protein
MAETAAHLVDHVLPPLPMRQWVLAVPKRLRYFLPLGRRGQCPVYFGKPTLVIKSSPNCVGIVLIDISEFRMAGCNLGATRHRVFDGKVRID